MKVLPIQQTYFTNYLKLKNEEPKPLNCEPLSVPEMSVYSKGMSGLTFGMAAPLKTAFEREIAEQPEVLKKLINKYFTQCHKVDMDLNISKAEAQ